ncbi:hypothetical protein [Microbacterium sp. 1P06AB]|uniref:hypothetical protein n=1 Tax=Microbacterium sp. 1P06AB TaxID=3132289 RepID=UPI0039A5D164
MPQPGARRKGVRAGRRRPQGGVRPILGIASCILLLTQQSGTVWLFGAGLLVVGVALFFATRWLRSRAGEPVQGVIRRG